MSTPSAEEIRALVQKPNECTALILQVLENGCANGEGDSGRAQAAAETLAESIVGCKDESTLDLLEDLIVDACWMKSAEAAPVVPPTEKDEKAGLVNDIIKLTVEKCQGKESFVRKLQENLMAPVAGDSGLLSEQDLRRARQYNTNTFFRQQKYNILQEESEGFAKLIQFLHGDHMGDSSKYLERLLGTFSLDPFRAVDLILDHLEYFIDATVAEKHQINWLVDLLVGLIPHDKLLSILAFRVRKPCDETSQAKTIELLASLVEQGKVDLEVFFKKFLPPIGPSIIEADQKFWSLERRRILGLTRVSLSGKLKEDPKLKELSDTFEQSLNIVKQNPGIHLLSIMLRKGLWEHVRLLLPMSTWKSLTTLLQSEFGFAFCDHVQCVIKGWCKSHLSNPLVEATPGSDAQDSPMDVDCPLPSLSDFLSAVTLPLYCVTSTKCIVSRSILYCQLCRLLRKILEVDNTISQGAYDFLQRFLVPSMSLFDSNPAISSELWSVLQNLPYTTRYKLYEDWKGRGLEREGVPSSSSDKSLVFVESEILAGKKARYSLKRLSKDNIRDASRQIAKVTHSNPMVVFVAILNQIESYDNLVDVVVEATQFVGPLGLDVLGYCILSRLSSKTGGINRSRLKDDGVNVSQWLQSLEAFTGSYYRKCPFVELRGILCYLLRQLMKSDVMELGLLRTLLKEVGGCGFADYSPAASLSSAQLTGLAGSVNLRRETMSFGIVDNINNQASKRLKEMLEHDGFGVKMLLLIARVQSQILFESAEETKRPLKLIANLFDSCQVVMTILQTFLTTVDDSHADSGDRLVPTVSSDFASSLPPLDELVTTYGFSVFTAWSLSRPVLRFLWIGGKGSGSLTKFKISPIVRDFYVSKLEEGTKENLTTELFEVFHSLELYDIFCPEEMYDSEIERLKKEQERLDKAAGNQAQAPNQSSSSNGTAESARIKNVSAALTEEKVAHKQHVEKVLERLRNRMESFFNESSVRRKAAEFFFTQCIFPRSTRSPQDALYSAKFALMLHKMDTPGFGLFHFVDILVSAVAGAMFGVTEGEAANLAILLGEVWTFINGCRYSEGDNGYALQVAGKPGSFVESTGRDGNEEVSKSAFDSMYSQWHSKLGHGLVSALESTEYMHNRSSLVVLTRIVHVFPTKPGLGNRLLDALAPFQDQDNERMDIKATANAYASMLAKARDAGSWLEEDAAVAERRANKEREEAEARKKKIEIAFREIAQDSNKITAEIGPKEGDRDRRRDDRNHGGGRRDDSNRALLRRESGELSSRDRRDAGEQRRSPDLARPRTPPRRDRMPSPPRRMERGGRPPSPRRGSRDQLDWERRQVEDRGRGIQRIEDRHPGQDSRDGRTEGSRPRDDRDDDRRSRRSKRSRESSPEEDRGRNSKRSRRSGGDGRDSSPQNQGRSSRSRRR